MWLYPCPDLGKPSNKKNRKCGFIPQEGGLCPNPQILKSLDFLFFGGGCFLDPKYTNFKLFFGLEGLFQREIGEIFFSLRM